MYQLGKHLTYPHFLLLVLMALLLLRLWWRRQETRGYLIALTLLYLGFLVPSIPAVSSLGRESLEGQFPPLHDRPQDAQAIVVLDGGVSDSITRCERAAELYHAGRPCPVLISSSPDTSEFSITRAMHRHLSLMGVPDSDILEDSTSGNTFENAVSSRAMLEPKGITRIVLVTDAMHLPRATACFRKQGFDVVPAGCDYDRPRESPLVFQCLPDARALGLNQYVTQEWLGLGWYWIRGRI